MIEPKHIINDVRDVLLTDVAIRIQLSPTNYQLAVRRVATLAEWLDREDSELACRVQLVYVQGSMAVNATIASCLNRDEFDIDVIAQLNLPDGTTPQQALDLLYRAIRGEKGSRYYHMTVRNTRCVTVNYAQMHVDITPAELLPAREPRVSDIFHHRPEQPGTSGERIIANPYGFAEWFHTVTPRDLPYAEFFERRSRALDPSFVEAKAETEDVPKQMPAYMKPPAVVALQLIKRFRNVQYDKRAGRRPPSAMLAKLVGESSSASGRPYNELLYQGRRLLSIFEEHQHREALMHVVNPTCREDVLTDRWPDSLESQGMFVTDLSVLVSQLELIEINSDLKTIAEVFTRLFGENPTGSVIREFADRAGASIARGQFHSTGSSGRAEVIRSGILAGVVAPAAAKGSRVGPRHTFYGQSD